MVEPTRLVGAVRSDPDGRVTGSANFYVRDTGKRVYLTIRSLGQELNFSFSADDWAQLTGTATKVTFK